MKIDKLFVFAIIVILILVCLLIVDHFSAYRGTFDHCQKIRIGDSKFKISLKHILYKDTSHLYIMVNPCEKDQDYYLEFKRNIIIKRVSKIFIHYRSDYPIEQLNDKLVLYGFDEQIKTKNRSAEFYNEEKTVKFSVGIRDYGNNVPIDFIILK